MKDILSPESATALERSNGARSGTDTAGVIAWLNRIADACDFTLPPPERSPRAVAICRLLRVLSAEYADYRSVVAGARDVVRRNDDELAAVCRSTREQGSFIRATASAAARAGAAANLMSTAATDLLGFAKAATSAAAQAGEGLARIEADLSDLTARLVQGRTPLGSMRESTNRVAAFTLTLARLSRQAQLLAVNASIEAAHLAEAGSRFAIVAREVRQLSISTRESKAGVAHIVAELRASTAQVDLAADDSRDATAAATREISAAREALARTSRGIGEFRQMVVAACDVADLQSTALQAVSVSTDQIARHADEAARASAEAAKLDLDALLTGADRKASRWRLLERDAFDGGQVDAFGVWIAAIIAGERGPSDRDVDGDSDQAALMPALGNLLDRVHGDQRAVLADIVGVAIAVARNSLGWRSIAVSLDGVSEEVRIVREAVNDSSRGAGQSAMLAADMQRLVEAIRAQYDRALQSLSDALARISRIAETVREIDGFVASMNAAAGRADAIMALIETLSSETVLLSLNAAIEAAHAGDQGRGFSVIAQEIRALARSTNDSTVSVSELVSNISTISGALQTSIGDAATSTQNVTSAADGVRTAIAQLREAFEEALRHALAVSGAAADQKRALDEVGENIDRGERAARRDTASATNTGSLLLATLGSRAHAIAARRPIGTVVERVRAFGERLCTHLEAVYEAALVSGPLTIESLFDFSYRPIAGSEIRTLARLFDISLVPEDGFTPVKYATPWDAAVDEALNAVLDDAYDEAAAFRPVAMFISDLNGLLYAYPSRNIAGWANDSASDNAGNRIKRMFEDEYALRVARWGLGEGVENVGPRATYAAFRDSGCKLARGTRRPWGAYVYARDTSVVCNEVVLALYARDSRHSTLRICYDANLI